MDAGRVHVWTHVIAPDSGTICFLQSWTCNTEHRQIRFGTATYNRQAHLIKYMTEAAASFQLPHGLGRHRVTDCSKHAALLDGLLRTNFQYLVQAHYSS